MANRKINKRDRVDKRGDRKPRLDDVWPAHSAGGWPQYLSLDRLETYDGRTRHGWSAACMSRVGLCQCNRRN